MKLATNMSNISYLPFSSLNGLFQKKKTEDFFIKTNPQADIFESRNLKNSFTGSEQPSISTINYIKAVKSYYNGQNRDLTSLLEFNPKKIKDICSGLKVFDGWSSQDLLFASTNFDSILLQRGCYKQCSHCGADSDKKIVFMNWNNYTDMTDDIGTLTKRLGFNPFMQDKLFNTVYPFHDSDPIDFRSQDLRGKVYDIYDAAKYYYNKTGTRFVITTAGWADENTVAHEAISKLIKDDTCIRTFNISIHPFHSYMEKSRQFRKNGDVEKAKYFRDKYINIAAKDIAEVFPLIKRGKANIILEYSDKRWDAVQDYTYLEVINLLKEILLKVKLDNPHLKFEHLLRYEAISNLENQHWISIRKIQSKGRAEKILGEKQALYDTNAKDLYSENVLNMPKYIDFDGRILANLTNDTLKKDFASLPMRLKFSYSCNKNPYQYQEIPRSTLIYNTYYDILDRDREINA